MHGKRKNRSKKKFSLSRKKWCVCCGKNKVPRHHHTLCNECGKAQNERPKGLK